MESNIDPTGFKLGTSEDDIKLADDYLAEQERLKAVEQQQVQEQQAQEQVQQQQAQADLEATPGYDTLRLDIPFTRGENPQDLPEIYDTNKDGEVNARDNIYKTYAEREHAIGGGNALVEGRNAVVKGGRSALRSVLTAPERYVDMIRGEDVGSEEYSPDWDPIKNTKDPLLNSWWGEMTEKLVHYGLLTYGAVRGGGLSLATIKGGAAAGGIAAAVSDYSQKEENISAAIVTKIPQLEPVLGWLATKDTDHPLAKTFKTVVEDMGIGSIIDAAFLKFGPKGAAAAVKRGDNVSKQTLEQAKIELQEPGFRGHKNKPIADTSQGSPNSTGTSHEIYEQLNIIDNEFGAELGSTDAPFTTAQLTRMANESGMESKVLKDIAQDFLGDAKYQDMLRKVKSKHKSFNQVYKHSLNRMQEVMGRHATAVDADDFWKPISDLKADRLAGEDMWAMEEVVAADLVNSALLKQLRDHGIAGRELIKHQDIFATDGLMKKTADALVVGLTNVKRSRYLWGISGQKLQLSDPAVRTAIAKRTQELHDETVDGVRLMMQFLKENNSDELAHGVLEVFSMSNKIHNWKDFDAWMRQKLVGGEFDGTVKTGQMIKELQGMMVNSVLSGPKTPLRAILGTTSNAYLNSMNQALGAAMRVPFTGDLATAKASAASLHSMFEIIPDAWKVFKTNLDAYWTGDIKTIKSRYSDYQPLDTNWELMGEWARRNGTDGEKAAFNVANIARKINDNKWLTYSTRIMAATDDTFRYIMSKAKSREQALRDVLTKKGTGEITDITPQLLKEAEDLQYSKMLDADGNIDISKNSYLQSQFKEVTLTSEMDRFSKLLDQAFNTMPVLKPFFLFARTGINGLAMSAKNTPLLGALVNESRDILLANADDLTKVMRYGIESAEDLANAKSLVLGRQATGTAFVAMMSQSYLSGNLTGNGPQDMRMRQMWIDTGWQPRSIKIGNAWVSYDSLEPFGLVLSSIADVGDNMKLMGPEWAEDRLSRIALAVALAGPASKSYLQGLNQVIDAVRGQPGSIGRISSSLINNVLILSSLRNEIGKVLNPYMKELGSDIWSSIRNRNQFMEYTTDDQLSIKYDMLNGEPIKNWNFLQRAVNAISPLTFNIDKSTPGRNLLWNSNYDLRMSTYSAPDGINLKDSPKIRSMFQKAIGDQNLEKTLDQLANDPIVKKSLAAMEAARSRGELDINPMDLPHNDIIKTHIEAARKKAWAKIRNTPEVKALYEEQRDLEQRTAKEAYNASIPIMENR